MRHQLALVPLFSLAIAACGSEVVAPNPGDGGEGGAGAGGATGGSGGIPPIPPTASASAPTQFTLELSFGQEPPAEALELSRYAASGDYGALTLESIAQDGNTITITTSKQKLGVEYTVTFAGEADFADFSETVPSADTAKFWTTDLSSPQFDEYEIVAERRAVGEHVVVYVQQGMSAFNVGETVQHFDEVVFPTEIAMFNDAPDQDDNDRVLLLGLDGKGAYGGYFSPVDTIPDDVAFNNWGIHSNETDMLYINVEGGGFDNQHVVPHEFSHMLYHVEHDSFQDWSWHNEGMAECAVHLVNGNNTYDEQYYVADPSGGIRDGISIVNWQYGNFDQYVLSYMFLTYVAAQSGGVNAYGTLFDLDGSPAGLDAWLQQNLGMTFPETIQNQMVALWKQDASGVHSYNGMVSLPGSPPVGNGFLNLQSFSGAFRQPSSPVSYQGTEGPDIVFIGVNGAGAVDYTEPFDIAGGALVVVNTDTTVGGGPQPAGDLLPLAATITEDRPLAEMTRARMIMHPPPFNPARLDRMRAWQRVAHAIE